MEAPQLRSPGDTAGRHASEPVTTALRGPRPLERSTTHRGEQAAHRSAQGAELNPPLPLGDRAFRARTRLNRRPAPQLWLGSSGLREESAAKSLSHRAAGVRRGPIPTRLAPEESTARPAYAEGNGPGGGLRGASGTGARSIGQRRRVEGLATSTRCEALSCSVPSQGGGALDQCACCPTENSMTHSRIP